MTALVWLDAYRANPERTEWDAGSLVTKVLAPDYDAKATTATIGDLKSRIAAEGTATPAALCEFIASEGFAGERGDYYDLDNSRLDRLLEQRRGIPITLALVYIEIGRAAGLAMHGIGFPGHFLVRASRTLIDPFANAVILEADWREWLRNHDLLEHAGVALTRAEPDDVALRMFNNVKGILFGRADHASATTAFDVIDCQLALGAEPVALYLERAELWRRFGSVDGVRAALREARDATTDNTLRTALDARLAAMPKAPDSTAH